MKCQRCDNFILISQICYFFIFIWGTFECQTLHICEVISCEVNMLNHLLILLLLFREKKYILLRQDIINDTLSKTSNSNLMLS